jgi:heme A synthase
MKSRDTKPRVWRPIHRFGFTLLGLMLIAPAALILISGRSHYQNYWGAPVFAPFAIFAGLLCWIAVLTHWKKKEKE